MADPQFNDILIARIIRGEIRQRLIDYIMEGKVLEWNRLHRALRESNYACHPEARKQFGEIEHKTLKDLDLEGCDLHGIDLDGFTVSRCLLRNAALDDARLTTVFVDCDLKGASMQRSQGAPVFAYRNDITGASFQGSTLHWANFTGCCVSGVNFRDTDLVRATLVGTYAWHTTKRGGLRVDDANRDYITACIHYEVIAEKREREMLDFINNR